MTTNNPILYNSAIDEPPITMTKPVAQPQEYNMDNIIKADITSFSNLIGKITNTMTTFISLLGNSASNDVYKKSLRRKIKLGRYFQGMEIDSCKLGKKVYMPKKWTDQTKKLPYFLMYKYPHIKEKYDSVHNQFKKECKKKFDIPFYELFTSCMGNKKMKNMLKRYNKKIPVIKTNCQMNQLCHYIESWEKENFYLPYKNKDYFDTTPYMTDSTIKMNPHTYIKIEEEYKKFMNEYNKAVQQRYESKQWKTFYDNTAKRCIKICPNIKELANYAVDITYNVEKNKDKHKKFAWIVAYEGILENLKAHSNGSIEIPIETGNKEDTEYLGRYYKLHRINI